MELHVRSTPARVWQGLTDADLTAEQPFHQVWQIADLSSGACKLSVEQDEFDPAGAHARDVASGMPFILSSCKSLLETGEGLPAPAN
jgi:hypothetical protein